MNLKKGGKRRFSEKRINYFYEKGLPFSPEYFENIEQIEKHLNLNVKKKIIQEKNEKKKETTKNLINFLCYEKMDKKNYSNNHSFSVIYSDDDKSERNLKKRKNLKKQEKMKKYVDKIIEDTKKRKNNKRYGELIFEKENQVYNKFLKNVLKDEKNGKKKKFNAHKNREEKIDFVDKNFKKIKNPEKYYLNILENPNKDKNQVIDMNLKKRKKSQKTIFNKNNKKNKKDLKIFENKIGKKNFVNIPSKIFMLINSKNTQKYIENNLFKKKKIENKEKKIFTNLKSEKYLKNREKIPVEEILMKKGKISKMKIKNKFLEKKNSNSFVPFLIAKEKMDLEENVFNRLSVNPKKKKKTDKFKYMKKLFFSNKKEFLNYENFYLNKISPKNQKSVELNSEEEFIMKNKFNFEKNNLKFYSNSKRGNSEKKNSKFYQTKKKWLNKKNSKINLLKKNLEDEKLKECTFKPNVYKKKKVKKDEKPNFEIKIEKKEKENIKNMFEFLNF